jgi:hypothetical protein
MKIRPAEAELLCTEGYTDRQTDMTKLIVAFYNFTNAPENVVTVYNVAY